MFSSGHPGLIVHNAILVDERTNIYEFSDVVWALATRSRPNLQQTFFEDVLGYPLVPFMSHGPGGPTTKGGKVVTDALFPYQYSSNPADQHEYEICDFINGYPKELQEKVNALSQYHFTIPVQTSYANIHTGERRVEGFWICD